MKQEDLLQGLSEAEYGRLAGILAGIPDPRTMSLEELDGYLAAVVCLSDDTPPEEILAQIWGGELSDEEVFADEAAMEEFVRLTLRHWNGVLQRLETDEEFVPLLLRREGDEGSGHDWANGFVRGIGLNPEQWSSLFEDEELSPALMPIFTLAFEHDPDPKLRPSGGPLQPEERDTMVEALAAAVPVIFDFFADEGELDEELDDPGLIDRTSAASIPYEREVPKVGRNEPCPCGSGKKYKRCCGADAG
jgi:uncharacterized protein